MKLIREITGSDTAIREAYCACLGQHARPHAYQTEVARRVLAGENLVLRAPTGSGKTLSVLVPYIVGRRECRYSRLIYALPLRTLVHSIRDEAERVVRALDVSLTVTVQTGEDPDDEFFARGDIIVCTYDQLLSGLLGGPYGLSPKLANMNAACVAGALVVFDEFHLMDPDRAFLTGAAALEMFRGLTQSVWMSATATEPLVRELASALGAGCVDLPEADWAGVPSVARVQRTVRFSPEPLTGERLLEHRGRRVIAIVNQVDRAQALYREVAEKADCPVQLLHSRFFRADRARKEAWLRACFGRSGVGAAILICTQVIEAGIDITSDVLLTELAPMNALVQRAGRCARFPPASGTGTTEGEVVVCGLPEGERPFLPYEEVAVEAARGILERDCPQGVRLDPRQAAAWVQEAHADSDGTKLRAGWGGRQDEVLEDLRSNVLGGVTAGIEDRIREADDSVRVFLQSTPPERIGFREPIALSRGRLLHLCHAGDPGGWAYVYERDQKCMVWMPMTPGTIRRCYYACLPPAVASYSEEMGLEPGRPGTRESPPRTPRPRPGYGSLHRERWVEHTTAVIRECEQRAAREVPEQSRAVQGLQERWGVSREQFLQAVRLCGLFHDFGKLQLPLQRWLWAYETARDPAYQAAEPLAHSQYDWQATADCQLSDQITEQCGHRPPHAWQGACFLLGAEDLLAQLSDCEEMKPGVAAACCAAIIGHHGGWIPRPGSGRTECHTLAPEWRKVAPLLSRFQVEPAQLAEVEAWSDKRALLDQCVEAATGPEELRTYWPLVALLTRILRLSDQKATAEGAGDE